MCANLINETFFNAPLIMNLQAIKSKFISWMSLFVLLLVIGVAAWFSREHHWVFDWTRDNRNTLTQTSQSVLEQIDQPIQMTVLARNSATERQQFRRAIEKYQRYNSEINLKFLDADLELDQANELHLYNAGQLRIDYKDRFEIVDQISELEVTNALQRLSRENKSWVVFLSGHGERDPFSEDNQGYSTLKETLESGGVEVQDINLLETTTIPDNISVLVIAAPQAQLLEGEEKLIIDFINRGGNLLWLHEPGRNDQLALVAQNLGLTWVNGTIIDANQQLRSILGIQHPAVVPVIEYQDHPITKGLKNQTLYPFAVGLEANPKPDWIVQPLFYSLPRAWSETNLLSGDNVVFNSTDGDTAGPILMATALTRINKNKAIQRIVIIGDSDFMANSYIGHGENLTLSVSVLQWLANEDERISLVPYQPPDVSIEFSNVAIASLASGYLLIGPLGVLLIGVLIGIRRRKA